MPQKQLNKTDAKELVYIYVLIVAASLLIHNFTRGDELSKYKSNPMFMEKKEGSVGDSSKWDSYYSLPVIG